MRSGFLARASALALSCALFPAVSFADDAAPVDDTIVVTAQFREQNILEVPLAVTAYTGEFLEKIGVDEFEQLSAYVPGFIVQEQSVNNPGFVLRGITSDDGASTIEPRVSVFQNGVSIARSRGSIVKLHDIERVEVLKGPQGTLFGRSAQIGAVHVITNKPTYEFGGAFGAEFGNFGQQAYNGFLNIPLVEDKLAVRAAASYEKRDGFIDNPLDGEALNGTDTLAIRGSVRAEPFENFRIDIIGNYSKDEPPGTSFKSGVIPALGGTARPNEFATLNTFGNFLGGAELGVDRTVKDLTGIFTWKLSDTWSVVSTSAWREFDSLEVFDPDGTALNLFIFAEDARGEQWSSDMRFSYDNGGRLAGFFGGGAFSEKGSQSVPLGFDVGTVAGLFGGLAAVTDVAGQQTLVGSAFLANAYLSGDPAVVNAALGLAGIPVGVYQSETFTNYADNFSFDLFGEVSYALTDRLTFTAGGRWTRDRKETLFSSEITELNPITPFIIGTPAVLVGDSGGQVSSDGFPGIENKFSGFSWRAVLNYEFADGKYVYANYSRGRRPEVIEDDFATTPSGGATPSFNVIPAETVSSYEIGLKGAFFDGLATLESAAYYYTYDNFQTGVTQDAGPGMPPLFVTVNAGTAQTYGAEMGLNIHPSDGLDFFFTYGWNHSRFDDEDADGNPQIFAGNRFRLSPDHSLSAGFNWRKETSFGALFLTPTYTWKSSVYFEDENSDGYDVVLPGGGPVLFSVPAVSQDAFGLLNIRAGLDVMDGAVTFEAYAENLLDKEYIIDAGNTGGAFGIPTYIAGAPRFYGGGVKVRF